MIHIITNHHKTLKWLNLQSEYLQKNTIDAYKVYCGATDLEVGIEEEKQNFSDSIKELYEFHTLENVINRHPDKLNYLVNLITLNEENKNDLLVFLDPDAFPIFEAWDTQIKTWLEQLPVFAINRGENIEPLLKENQKPYPHPCFFATTIKFWKENNLSWDIDSSQGADCAGVLLKKWLDQNNHGWGKLIRTNCFNLHPLNFGVYGNMIYHHGSGNRPVYDSIDIWSRPGLAQKYGVSLDLNFPGLLTFNKKISDLVFEQITDSEDFIKKYFLGVE
tara:strand:+ start:8139 stop:8966 length:828 start_codon:yes stop_codon:yes gene_type:complete